MHTSNGFLERESLNISEMAYIGKILVQEERSTSTNEILEFRIDRLEFTMSSARNVNEGDLKPHANSVGSGPTIGTARYVLLEANISLDDGREYEVVGDPLGSEVQLVSDREDTRNVRVVPVLPRTALQTTIKGLKITCRKNGVNGNVPVSVSVDRCHIKPIIELHNEAAVSTREMEAARQNLIDQIFRKRLPGGSKDRLVLSRAVGRSDE